VWETMSLEPMGTEQTPEDSDPVPVASEPLHCRVVHRIGRRVRLRIDPTDAVFEQSEALDAFLREQAGVADVTLNPACGSVRLDVEPDQVTALVAAVATASGRVPEVAGKPEQPTVALVRERLGTRGVMVGDRPSTDGAMADALGWPFALVLSGVTAEIAPPGGEAIPSPPPPYVAADVGELAPRLMATLLS